MKKANRGPKHLGKKKKQQQQKQQKERSKTDQDNNKTYGIVDKVISTHL